MTRALNAYDRRQAAKMLDLLWSARRHIECVLEPGRSQAEVALRAACVAMCTGQVNRMACNFERRWRADKTGRL